MNPRPPTPQAGIIDHTRRPPPLLPDSKQHEMIINTLIKLRNDGKADNTIISVSRVLQRISEHADLSKPEEVKAYISTAAKQNGEPLQNSTKTRYVCSYDCLCRAYGIQWEKPRFRYEEHIPIIPSTENVNKIIGASSKRYATIFTLLAEMV